MGFQVTLTGRSRSVLIGAVRMVGRAVDRALDALGAEHRDGPAPAESVVGDRSVTTVQHAQRAALAVRDYPLARRLGEVEADLLRRRRPAPEPVLSAVPDRRQVDVQLEGLRRTLLASTPRPGLESGD